MQRRGRTLDLILMGRAPIPRFHRAVCGYWCSKDSLQWSILRSSNSEPPMSLEGHVWTVPAVQEEFDYQRSVRVRSCIRPVVAWRITSVAMQPLWPLALM